VAQSRPRLKNKVIVGNGEARTQRSVDMDKDADGLNYRQRRFVSEFASSLNATEAAIKSGYSKNGAGVTGSQLLRNPYVARAVEKVTARRLSRADITAERVLSELASVGFSETDPSLPKASEKIAALGLLAKHLGLLVERHEVDARTSVLNVNVSAADLESARQLVESTMRGNAPVLVEGKGDPDDERHDR
jgi:phage terminase small subunit